MLGLKFNAPKCETNARLCLGRIRLLKNKKNMQMRGYRKDIADLLKAGKLDYAIIRVESVIREQLTLTAYEILELYLELVAVRATMVAQSKAIPGDMMEALSSVLYASSRCPELEELAKLRALFEHKYGKEYVSCALSDRECHRFSVNDRLIRCLTVEPPPPDLKLQTLSEIAQEYAIEWDAAEARRVLLGDTPGGAGMLYSAGAAAGAGAAGSAAAQQPAAAGPPAVTGLLLRPSDETLDILSGAPPAQPQPQQQPAAAGAGGYADIAAAAQAAAVAAQQAQAAANAAARMAASSSSQQQQGAGAHAAAGAGAAAGGPVPIRHGGGPPQQGWLADMENFQHIQPAAPAPAPAPAPATPSAAAGAGVAGSSSSQAPAAAGAGAAGGAGGAGGFKVPSAEEIQKAYDQAQGPPPKPHLPTGDAADTADAAGRPFAMAPPPAAPPVKASDEDLAAAAAAANGGAGGSNSFNSSGSGSGISDLPSVPGGHSSSGGGSSQPPPSDFDELQRRFDALKKS